MSDTTSAQQIHEAWRRGDELGLIDAREEDEFARGHPLFAASLPLGRLELEVLDRFPRRSVPIVCYGDDTDRAERLTRRLGQLGYSNVSLLEGGISSWLAAGFELFIDVNAPSKAFGELVAERCRPPFIDPEVLHRRLVAGDKGVAVLDVRPFEEFSTMSIPTARNLPGGELVYRTARLIKDATTALVVNCAGRTRSIIGAQSLRNAGYLNPIAALRNGTIGWTLAGLELDHGAVQRFDPELRSSSEIAANVHQLACHLGVHRIQADELAALVGRTDRTTYCFDVRERTEYEAGHAAGFRHAPGGQLVQETDVFAPVRGATIVCCDDDGVRAEMTASWLAQMGWEVVTTVVEDAGPIEVGDRLGLRPELPEVRTLEPMVLDAISKTGVRIFDLASSQSYRNGHLKGAEFVLRGELATVVAANMQARVVLTSEDGVIAAFAAEELAQLGARVEVLDGGTSAWLRAGYPVTTEGLVWTSAPIDRYRRPYEGTDVDPSAMQAYLDWEYGLVAQLERDGAHRFSVYVPTN